MAPKWRRARKRRKRARKKLSKKLPRFVEPMLAQRGAAFDSDDYFYEIKWDGFRAISLVEENDFRFFSRNKLDFRKSFAEFDFLRQLPKGVVIDGELVALKNDKPNFQLLLQRFRNKLVKVNHSFVTVYVVFDILYRDYQAVLNEDLFSRREMLQETIAKIQDERLIFSDGIRGQGKAFHEQAVAQGLEGIIAKKINSAYLPGKRTDAWIKIKKHQQIFCSIIGFLPKDKRDFKSLLLATDIDGVLTYVGNVGSGFNLKLRQQINDILWQEGLQQKAPIVPCDPGRSGAIFMQSGYYCKISFLEFTDDGILRAPVFEQLIFDDQ